MCVISRSRSRMPPLNLNKTTKLALARSRARTHARSWQVIMRRIGIGTLAEDDNGAAPQETTTEDFI